MKRMTRKSFRRRRMLLGIGFFMSIAFISTGFAAWVLSTDVQHNQNGNVIVGTVTDNSLAITMSSDTDQNIIFDAAEGDTEGRLQWDGVNFADLVIELEGTVGGVSFCKSLTVQLVVEDAAEKARLDAAIAAGYIVAPDCYTAPVQIYDKLVEGTTPGTKDKFAYNVEFKWGATFGGENPTVFYDNAGVNVEDDEMEATLASFYKLMYDADDYKTGSLNDLGSPITFKIIITASATVPTNGQ